MSRRLVNVCGPENMGVDVPADVPIKELNECCKRAIVEWVKEDRQRAAVQGVPLSVMLGERQPLPADVQLRAAVNELLALDLENDGATCEWVELVEIVKRLRAIASQESDSAP